MQIDDFDKGRREADALRKERPWRKDAQPIGKPPSNPNYPKMPFNFDGWMKSLREMKENDDGESPGEYVKGYDNWAQDARSFGFTVKDERGTQGNINAYNQQGQRVGFFSSGPGPGFGLLYNTPQELENKVKKIHQAGGISKYSTGQYHKQVKAFPGKYRKAAADIPASTIKSMIPKLEEDSDEVPEIGDTIRTKKMQMEGKVEQIGQNRAGYDEVLFRIEDGRLMKTPLSNVIVIQKLADEDNGMFEDRVDELTTELLAKYKTAAGKDYSVSNKAAWDPNSSSEESDSAMRRSNKRFNGIVKATNKQFDNDKKKHINEDDNFTPEDIKKLETINDLPTLKAQAKQLIKGKAARRMKADKIAFFYDKVDGMTSRMAIIKLMYDLLLAGEDNAVIGSRNNSYRSRFGEGSMGGINRVPELGLSYEKVLDSMSLEEKLSVFLETDFGDIVRSQNEGPKPGQTIDKEYNGWIVRYQLAPRVKGQPVQWMAWHSKKDPSTAKRGSASTPDKAFQDATAFINDGGGEKKEFKQNHVTIDFNVDFSRQIVPGSEGFFAKIDDGFLMVSLRPQEGFGKASPRAETIGNERFWSMAISPKEAQAQRLVPNGRYRLGNKEDIDDETWMFEIQFQSVAQSTADRLRMKEPGFTVATAREVNEIYQGPHIGDPAKLAKAPKSTMQGDKTYTFSQKVQDTINTHGVKWAFDYYVKKHGLPPRQFKIFAGL